jgi:cell division protein FtsQ
MREAVKSRTGTTPPLDPATLRSRKRFARRQWARRWLAWRRVVVLLLLITLLVGTVWLVYFSDVLAVKEVEVHGTRTLASEEVREVASGPGSRHWRWCATPTSPARGRTAS